MSVQLLRRKFTVKQYHKMAESGIITDNDRVELIRGEIIEMSAIGTKHAACVNRLVRLFTQLGSRIILAPQNPVVLNDNSEPQPDVALLKPREDFYETAHPQPENIFLLIEVADTTVKYDREVKIPLYAENNIVEVWLVDINEQYVEVYREPTREGYQNVQKFTRGHVASLRDRRRTLRSQKSKVKSQISIQAFPDVNITVDEILGR